MLPHTGSKIDLTSGGKIDLTSRIFSKNTGYVSKRTSFREVRSILPIYIYIYVCVCVYVFICEILCVCVFVYALHNSQSISF